MQHRLWILAAAVACAAPKDSQVTPRDSSAPTAAITKDSVRASAEDSAVEAFMKEYDRPLPPPPKVEGYPIVYRNKCMGESCSMERIVVACQDVPLHESDSKDSPLSLVLKKGDTATAGEDLHVLAPGIVVVKRDFVHDHVLDDDGRRVPLPDTIRFTRGDTIFLVLYGALGTWRAKYRGKEMLLSEFWGAPRRLDRLGGARTDSTDAVLRSEFYFDTWWPVKLPDGRTGWKFRNQDADLPLMVYKHTHEPWDWKCKDT